MDTLAIIKLAILDGKLRPEESPLAQDIIERHGVATFNSFLAFLEMDERKARIYQQLEVQARINRQLGISDVLVRKYNP